jgi:hypothetical protein
VSSSLFISDNLIKGNTLVIPLDNYWILNFYRGRVLASKNTMAIDQPVAAFTHLKDKPRPEAALALLQRVASLVKPIMKKHSWKLPVLAEIYPNDRALQGAAKLPLRWVPLTDWLFVDSGLSKL